MKTAQALYFGLSLVMLRSPTSERGSLQTGQARAIYVRKDRMATVTQCGGRSLCSMPIWQVRSTTTAHRTCASSWTMFLLARTPKTLVLDLGGVGLWIHPGGLILGRQRCARSPGGTPRIQHAPEQLRRVLRLLPLCTDAGQEE